MYYITFRYFVSNIRFGIICVRGVAPISDLGNGMRNAATMRLPSEKNLEHYKRENPNRIPVFNDPRDDPNVRF